MRLWSCGGYTAVVGCADHRPFILSFMAASAWYRNMYAAHAWMPHSPSPDQFSYDAISTVWAVATGSAAVAVAWPWAMAIWRSVCQPAMLRLLRGAYARARARRVRVRVCAHMACQSDRIGYRVSCAAGARGAAASCELRLRAEAEAEGGGPCKLASLALAPRRSGIKIAGSDQRLKAFYLLHKYWTFIYGRPGPLKYFARPCLCLCAPRSPPPAYATCEPQSLYHCAAGGSTTPPRQAAVNPGGATARPACTGHAHTRAYLSGLVLRTAPGRASPA
jgi:hypothetical protein